MKSYLVCYDYGQGGVWFYVDADDPLELSRTYPELLVFHPDKPPWWNDEYEAAAGKNRGDEEPFKSILEGLRKSGYNDANR